ncbi:MAG: OmpA family protein, partial [Hyphomicrobiales bacterium]|nr:OmpA family protein [Hyphomicrobiales bacterium]
QGPTGQATAPSEAPVLLPRRLTAAQKQEAERKQRRLRRVREARKARASTTKASARQLKRRKKRRLDLQVVISGGGITAELTTRRQRRLDRQLSWERQQARRDRRLRRDFGFHRRARVIRRRNDRIIYAGLALAAIGAATGGLFVYYDDDVRFGRRARDVYVEPLGNGWTRTVVVRPNGVRIVTIRDASGFIVRRYRVYPDNRVTFFYNNQPSWWDDADLYIEIAPVSVGIPHDRYIVEPSYAPIETIYETVTAPPVDDLDRTYTLNQILVNHRLRDYMPRIDLDTITFAPGSAQVPAGQIDKLESVGVAMERAIKENPDEVYLLEGHTDATGSDEANLELSDRRAAAVASVLTDNFDIPPENIVTQGYGEQFLKVDTLGPAQRNRRVAIRRITPLLSRDRQQVAFDDKGNEIFEEEGAGQ